MLSKKLESGDHVWSPGYARHGIYVGNNSVIHLSRDSKAVIETPLSQFVGDRKFYIRGVEPRDLPETIVRRAKGHLGKRINPVTDRSPEQFAVLCQCGRSRCMQLRIWIGRRLKPSNDSSVLAVSPA